MCGIWFYLRKPSSKKYSIDDLRQSFELIKHRGPDTSTFINIDDIFYIGFHRLAIMDLSEKGEQPFITSINNRKIYTIVNGEIYNFKQLKGKYKLETVGDSDCEIVHQLYIKIGIDNLIKELDGEFSFIIIEKIGIKTNIYACRDCMGVRPLFYSDDEQGIGYSSELKGLSKISKNIFPFKPRCYQKILIKGGIFDIKGPEYVSYYRYEDIKYTSYYSPNTDISIIRGDIYNKLIASIHKRLNSDRPIGFCLSGGLDSSIICGIASKLLKNRIKTFTIAFNESEDLINSRKVAKHINSIHKEFIVTPDECLKNIDTIIYQNETYDCTTTRASILNRMLIEKIKEDSPEIKVLFVGEFSDELSGGYSYFHNAINKKSFHDECVRLLNDIYLYDSLRCDRSIASQGMEARVPFSDKELIEYYLTINPKLRMPRYSEMLGYTDKKIEKALIREAFYDKDIIPNDILKFKKMAFSDQKQDNMRWFEYIQQHIEDLISNKEFDSNKNDMIDTKEKYYYKKIFNKLFGKNENVLPYMWLPKWCLDDKGNNIKEPSATVLDVFKN